MSITSIPHKHEKKGVKESFLRLRKGIGIMGVLLPILVLAGNKFELLASISHYYYTASALFFTTILVAFGIFLIAYRGYDKDTNREKVSDNALTNIGGFAALIVVLIPTDCFHSHNPCVQQLCDQSPNLPLFGHCIPILTTIHLLSAALFIFIMGWISAMRFSRSDDNKKLYKRCGYVIWACLAIMAIEAGLKYIIPGHNKFTDYDTYFFETIAVWAFAVSWLAKGKAMEEAKDYMKALKKKYGRKDSSLR